MLYRRKYVVVEVGELHFKFNTIRWTENFYGDEMVNSLFKKEEVYGSKD
jgi:hypothetical protein